MQTFLPYPSFTRSLACLDNKRLGKQRVECKQILMALEFGPYQYNANPGWVSCSEVVFTAKLGPYRYRRTPWYNHPATKMWRGYESSLAAYGFLCCMEWRRRTFQDSLLLWFSSRFGENITIPHPSWIHNEAFHLSHQSNLVRKDPAHYRQFFPDVPDNLPYVWPTP